MFSRLSRISGSVLVLAVVALAAVVGPVPAASAATAPGVQRYQLPRNTFVYGADGQKDLIAVDLNLRTGESRRVIGQVNAFMGTPYLQSIDFTAAVRCMDPSGSQRGQPSAWAQTSLVSSHADTLRPTLLFTAPTSGVYRCRLVVSTGDPTTPLVAQIGLTHLTVSAADEVGSRWWQNPDCDSLGSLSTCSYLGNPNGVELAYLLSNDGAPLYRHEGAPQYRWTASDAATSATMAANVELTTCGHTASCGGMPRHDWDGSTVYSYLEAIQLDALGHPCKSTQSGRRTDVIGIIPHHYNIAYDLVNVPVLATCGSRQFSVRVVMQWISGNPVKIDGSRPDPAGPEAETNAFAINSAYAPTTTVPTVTGMNQTAASNALTNTHLTVGTVTGALNPAAPGTVIAQIAKPGTVEPTGSPVNLTVSLGPAAPVPTSPGDQTTALGSWAAVSLSASGGAAPLTWSVSGLPAGLSATAAGQISGAPLPTSTPTNPVMATVTDANGKSGTVSFTWYIVAVVPDVVGLSLGSAVTYLRAAGLVQGSIRTLFDCDNNRLVIDQSPSAGTQVTAGTAVNLYIGTNRDPTNPRRQCP